MENPHFEGTLIGGPILLFKLSSAVELIILEIAFIPISFLRNIDPLAIFCSTFDWTFVTRAIGVGDLTMDETIITEEAWFLVFFCFQLALSIILVVPHTTLIGISIFLCNNRIGTVSIFEGSFEWVSTGIENASLTVLLTGLVDFSFVVATIEVGNFSGLCSHLINLNIQNKFLCRVKIHLGDS